VKVNSPIATLLADGEAPGAAPTKKAEAPKPKPRASAEGREIRRRSQDRSRRRAGSPAGTEFVNQTVRDALRDAMAEEMRRDELVFLMGEEVAEYQGAYKISQGLLEEVRRPPGDRHPITEHGFTGMGIGRAFDGLKPYRRIHDLELRHAGDGPDHQQRRQDALHVGRPDELPIVFRGPNGAAARVAAQHSQDYSAWYASVPGMKVIAPYFRRRCQGIAQGRDPRSQSGDLPGK
jgi:pyruvate dehydrogenase E1 component beta subunit